MSILPAGEAPARSSNAASAAVAVAEDDAHGQQQPQPQRRQDSAAPAPAPTTATTPPSSTRTLSLLQAFLKAQQTRTSISHELEEAFEEQGITDQALNKVIQISSIGLLEIRNEVQGLIDALTGSTGGTEDGAPATTATAAAVPSSGSTVSNDILRSIQRVEELEKERIHASVVHLQMKRMLRLREATASPTSAEAEATGLNRGSDPEGAPADVEVGRDGGRDGDVGLTGNAQSSLEIRSAIQESRVK